MIAEFKKPQIYLVGGKARHGKDTFSQYLKELYEKDGKKVIITYLGKYIKYYAREMTGWNLTEEDKPRELLQNLGTNIIREKLKKDDLFIKRIIDDIEIFSYFYDAIIISDVRLKKEINDIKEAYPNSIVVKINRINFESPLTKEAQNHITEIDLDDYNKFDEIIVNDTIEEFKEKIKNLYIKYEKEV